MPAGLKRASSAFLDSPVKPGNDMVEKAMVIIMRLLISFYPVSPGVFASRPAEI